MIDTNKTYTINGSRWKYILLATFGEGFLMGASWFCFVSETAGALMNTVGMIGLIFFGIAWPFLIYKAIVPKALEIGPNGIKDYSSLVGIHRTWISWDNIKSYKSGSMMGNSMIYLTLNDTSGISKRVLRANQPYGGDLILNVAQLKDEDKTSVLKMMYEFSKQYNSEKKTDAVLNDETTDSSVE